METSRLCSSTDRVRVYETRYPRSNRGMVTSLHSLMNRILRFERSDIGLIPFVGTKNISHKQKSVHRHATLGSSKTIHPHSP